MLIRNLLNSDLKTLEEFRKKGFEQSFPDVKMNLQAFKKKFERHALKNPGNFVVLEDDGKTAGYVWFLVKKTVHGKYGLIQHLYVDGKYRKRGLGKLLLEKAEHALKKKGIKRIRLSVTLGNPAIKLYEGQKYRKKRLIMEKTIR